MAEDRETIVVYGATWCPDCRRAKQFFGEQRVHYNWVDIERDEKAMAYVEEVNQGRRVIPTIVFPDGSVLAEPSNAQLADKLGLAMRAARSYYDVIIIGAGPAGLTAALYTAREGLDTLVIERGAPGGQAGVTQIIDNFPGFDAGISGEEFARRLTNQARRFGVEIVTAREVVGLRENGSYREVKAGDDGPCQCALAVLIATGARYRRLGVPGEDDLIGINIHFCATCDGAFYKGKEVLVIGGGNSAFEEGLFLTRFASRVTILARGAQPKASRILQDKVAGHHAMRVVTNHTVQEFIRADGRLRAVRVRDEATGREDEWHPEGVFVFVGMSPNSEFLPAEIERDAHGFVVTDRTLQTSMPGVFAAGDVRAGATAQAASAAGEGATAALMIRQFLQSATGRV